MEPPFTLQIGDGVLRPDILPHSVFRTVNDARGTYTIPYIQSARDLEVRASFEDRGLATLRLTLMREHGTVAVVEILPREPRARLNDLSPGEHSLVVTGYSAREDQRCRVTYERIGVGTVVAALGDSITEGYFGNGFYRGEHLTGADFPPEFVSRDGRNFPQYGPTTHEHLPEVNCLESWMTHLNDLLSDSFAHPVFIANEGWGGCSSAAYLELMRTDTNWQDRMLSLDPQLWLIHLGVNDGRAQVGAEEFGQNMEEVVRTLRYEYGAVRSNILVARPSYDYAEGAAEHLRAYCDQVDGLVERLGLSPGADLFTAYARDRECWYGEDPVHPNAAGMRRMAELWHEAIVDALRTTGGDR